MPLFSHQFSPAYATLLGPTVDLMVQEVEDTGLREVLQTPGVALGNWGLLGSLLHPGSSHFLFHAPLGQAREVKTAVSGLFGRFVARAYATRYLGFSRFVHVTRPPLTLEHLAREADLEWLMIDSMIVRTHQHAAGARRSKGGRMHRV